MEINEHSHEVVIGFDACTRLTLHARLADTRKAGLWFVGVAADNRWLGFVDADDFDNFSDAVAYLRSVGKMDELVRLALYVGEPWEAIVPAPEVIDELQTMYLNAIAGQLDALENLTAHQVRALRACEERDLATFAVADFCVSLN